jgi:hypothetical protein
MERYALNSLAMHAEHVSRPAETLAIASYALESGPLTPRVQALFTAHQARALAQQRREREARSAFAHAQSLYEQGTHSADPWWVGDFKQSTSGFIHGLGLFGDCAMRWIEGRILADISQSAAAVDSFAGAAENRPQGAARSRYHDLAHLLRATVEVGAWRDAGRVVEQIGPHVGVVGSRRVDGVLRQTAAVVRRAGPAAGLTVRDGLDDLVRRVPAVG